jgi:peptide/nickel transport system permease protein
MRLTDIFLALPPLILALCVGAILKPTLFNSMMAICIAWWPWYTRLVYGMAMSTKNEMYVKSAELLGASKAHIVFKEILPNCTGPIFTKMTLDMGWVILMGASLSFVGLGEQPPIPALGTMVSDGAKFIPGQWWISIFPAMAIMLIVLGFNFMGDGVKDMLSSEE